MSMECRDCSLTDAVLACKDASAENREDKKNRAIQLIALRIFHYAYTRQFLSEDEKSEFILRMFKKIPAMVDRFTYRGIPFEAYLTVYMKWQFKTCLSSGQQKRIRCEVVSPDPAFLAQDSRGSGYDLPDDYHSEYAAEPDCRIKISRRASEAFHADENGHIHDPVYKKRLLLIALKESVRLDEYLIESVAAVTGYEKKWITWCSNQLKKNLENKTVYSERMRHRKTAIFLKLCFYHEKICESLSSMEREHYLVCVMKERRKLGKLNQRINQMTLQPSNREIARLLGIPKGSVDTYFHFIKNKIMKQVSYSDTKEQEYIYVNPLPVTPFHREKKAGLQKKLV